MMELLREYLPVLLIAVLIGAIVGYLVFRPRQKVRLTDSAPTRPHMTVGRRDGPEGNAVTDEMAAAASDVTGQIIQARVHDNLPEATGAPDDLQRLKGVGPKLAQMLNAHGVIRFEQLARMTPDEVQRLDSGLGAFRDRLTRDRITEQAAYLARGDQDGFEQQFGKL